MRFINHSPSARSLEWRVAVAWILLVATLLIPATSSRDPHLLRYPFAWHVADFGLAVACLVLTIQPLMRGTAALRLLAAPCAGIAAWRLVAWIVILTLKPWSRGFPL